MIDQATLKSLLHYCPDLGLFWWKNGRLAGEIAGTRLNTGYGQIKVAGERHQVHRLAWFYMTGSWPADELDHRNGWKLDNAFGNLREATRSQNNANRRGYAASGFKGVTKTKGGRFIATINRNRKPEYLGTFDTPEQANAAYEKRAVEIHGAFARNR